MEQKCSFPVKFSALEINRNSEQQIHYFPTEILNY